MSEEYYADLNKILNVLLNSVKKLANYRFDSKTLETILLNSTVYEKLYKGTIKESINAETGEITKELVKTDIEDIFANKDHEHSFNDLSDKPELLNHASYQVLKEFVQDGEEIVDPKTGEMQPKYKIVEHPCIRFNDVEQLVVDTKDVAYTSDVNALRSAIDSKADVDHEHKNFSGKINFDESASITFENSHLTPTVIDRNHIECAYANVKNNVVCKNLIGTSVAADKILLNDNDLQATIDSKSNINHEHSFEDIVNKPTVYPPELHNHDDKYIKYNVKTDVNISITAVATDLLDVSVINNEVVIKSSPYTIDDVTIVSELQNDYDFSGSDDTQILNTGRYSFINNDVIHINAILSLGETQVQGSCKFTLYKNITSYQEIDSSNVHAILNIVYPIGSIYTSKVNKSPAELFHFGTWTQIVDRFLYATSGTSGIIGGEASHKLTVNEMPSHSHNIYHQGFWNCSSGSDRQTVSRFTVSSDPNELFGTTTSAGSGTPHNNMPPYITVYMWERTA